MKGVSLIAGIIFLALTISAATIIYQAGLPAVQQIQATAAVEKMKGTLSDLDGIIREVASEGKGSKRTVFISSDPGELVVNGSSDTISWQIETTAPIISPRTSQKFGNLRVGSNLETSVTESSFGGTPVYVMENEHLVVYVNRTSGPISTNSIVLAIYNKDLNSWLNNPGFLDISIDNNAASKFGTGYTEAESLGKNLPYGKVKAHISSGYLDYDVFFILESGADFITIEAGES